MSDDAISDNNNDLPDHWAIKTSSNPESHFEDLPLFPPLIEKPEIISPVKELLLENEDKEYLSSGEQKDTLLDDAINEEQIQVESKELLDSLETDVVVDEKVISTTPILEENVVANEAENISDVLPIYNELGDMTKNSVNVDIPAVPILPKKEEAVSGFIKNSNIVQSSKIIPVPHIKIKETVKSDHPLALPPRVIPFSTSAPSAHAKIAAVYTQPDAKASAWLPWMRTSMWSKKMVKRVTRDPNIEGAHAGLPVSTSKDKPNVIYSPVYIDTKIHNENGIKNQDIFEHKPAVVRMNYDAPAISAAPETPVISKVEEIIPTKDYIAPPINDSLDSEMFGNFVNKPIDVKKVEPIKHVTQDNKPKIDDSWDAAIFS